MAAKRKPDICRGSGKVPTNEVRYNDLFGNYYYSRCDECGQGHVRLRLDGTFRTHVKKKKLPPL